MIGFFDSGIGGLTVLKRAIKTIPNRRYIYFGDTKNIPCGEKTVEEVVALSREGVDFLVSRGAEVVVIACNTASSAAGQILRDEFKVPIICMEPAINLAFKDNAKKVLVLATNLTLHLEKYLALKGRLNIDIDEVAAPELVKFAEEFKSYLLFIYSSFCINKLYNFVVFEIPPKLFNNLKCY